jgi:hypothetical protein
MMSVRLMLAVQQTQSDGRSRRCNEAHTHRSWLKQQKTFVIEWQDYQLMPLLALSLGLALAEAIHLALV